MELLKSQIDTLLNDAIQRLHKKKTIVAGEVEWKAIREGVMAKMEEWAGAGEQEHADWAWGEVQRLDKLIGTQE